MGIGWTRIYHHCSIGEIKGKPGDWAHLLSSVPVTSSGIQVETLLRRLLDFKACRGFKTGPAISDLQGRVFEPKALNDALLEVLEDLFDHHSKLFPPSITNCEMLCQKYQAFRML
jgi:hypothetical protein